MSLSNGGRAAPVVLGLRSALVIDTYEIPVPGSDDRIVRTVDVGSGAWVETLVAANGAQELWDWDDRFEDGEEAREWLATLDNE